MSREMPLPERTLAYLARQRAWVIERLADTRMLITQLDAGTTEDLEAQVADAQQQMAALDDLEREQRGLLAEWQRHPVEDPTRDVVRKESEAVAALVAELTVAHGRLAQAVVEQRTRLFAEAQSLGRGREALRNYRPSNDGDTGLVDRHA